MQYKDEKNLQLTKKLAEVIRKMRLEKTNLSLNKFAYSFDISRGNLSKIENAESECKFVTFWKIAEALGLKPSEFVKILERELGEEFTLIDV